MYRTITKTKTYIVPNYNSKYPSRPFSTRALFTASLIAKKTEAAKNRGGSPIPYNIIPLIHNVILLLP